MMGPGPNERRARLRVEITYVLEADAIAPKGDTLEERSLNMTREAFLHNFEVMQAADASVTLTLQPGIELIKQTTTNRMIPEDEDRGRAGAISVFRGQDFPT